MAQGKFFQCIVNSNCEQSIDFEIHEDIDALLFLKFYLELQSKIRGNSRREVK